MTHFIVHKGWLHTVLRFNVYASLLQLRCLQSYQFLHAWGEMQIKRWTLQTIRITKKAAFAKEIVVFPPMTIQIQVSNPTLKLVFIKGDVPPACRSEACTSRCHRAPAASGPGTRHSAPRRAASSQDERSKTTKTESKPRPFGLDPGPRFQPAESSFARSYRPTDRRTRPTAAAASVPGPPPRPAPSAAPWPPRGRGGACRSPHGGPTTLAGPPRTASQGSAGLPPRCRCFGAPCGGQHRPAPPVCASVPWVRALLAVVSEVKAAQSRLPGGK